MDDLFKFQDRLLNEITLFPKRYLYNNSIFRHRLVGIQGIRGVGKSTMLLQYQSEQKEDRSLYVTADHPWFYNETLFGTAEKWYQQGGRILIIDEIHKYKNWSNELKNIYDGFSSMKIVFTSSSALDIYKGSADLSRRAAGYTLHGLSFREFLNISFKKQSSPISLQDLILHHKEIANDILLTIPSPLPQFYQYLKSGYLPICFEQPDYLDYKNTLYKIIDTVITVDMAWIFDYSPAYQQKIKKLLGIIAGLVPYIPSITELSTTLQVSRNTILDWIYALEKASLTKNLLRAGKGFSALQKPDKILFENTNFNYALAVSTQIGTIRETFFVNQVKNKDYKIEEANQGDFLVNEALTFEIGGKSKTKKQLKAIQEGYIIKDEIETGYNNVIPLWLFGFLY